MSFPPGRQDIAGNYNAQATHGAASVVIYNQAPGAADERHWNVPFPRNTNFTGRDELLAKLHTLLQTDGQAGVTQRHGLTGLGGLGKTQTAIEYAYRHRADYRSIFWLRAETRETLNSGFDEIARLISLPETRESDLALVVRATKRWLSTHGGWLLICDNADDPQVLANFDLPTHPEGRVLITSRAAHLDVLGISQALELDLLAPEEALAFILQRAGKESADASERENAASLTQELGYLPLALEQAGAFIKTRPGTTFQKYLTSYRKQSLDLLAKQAAQTGNYAQQVPRSVATTWSLNFTMVEETCPAASDLLHLSAFLSPVAIPMELLVKGAAELGPILGETLADLEDPLAFGEVVRALTDYSLVRVDESGQAYTLHRLVQAVQRHALDPAAQRTWLERAVRVLNRAFPTEIAVENWPWCERLLPHVRTTAQWAEGFALNLVELGRVLNEAAHYSLERGQYIEAETLNQQALSIRRKVLGERHQDTAMSLNNAAVLLHVLGNPGEAEPIHREALAIRKEVLGERHPDTALSLDNLAGVLRNRGKLAEAEALQREALAIRKEALGERHPDTATSLGNLAGLLRDRGKQAEAEALYRETLAIQKEVLGEHHPLTAISLGNLAGVLSDRGKLAEGEALFREALAIQKEALGERHPHTATSLGNLAGVLGNRGKQAESEAQYREALAIQKEVLGERHPDTAISLGNLAGVLSDRGKQAEAEALCREALAIQKEVLGERHPDTAISLGNLAGVLSDRGKLAEAEAQYREALAIQKEVLGERHPHTATSLGNLAGVLGNRGKLAEAEALQREALAIRNDVLGEHHPHTARTLYGLAVLLHRQGKRGPAMVVCQQALEAHGKAFGQDDPATHAVRAAYKRMMR